jgi:hypothetical protein
VGALAHAGGNATHEGGGNEGQPGQPAGQIPESGTGQIPGPPASLQNCVARSQVVAPQAKRAASTSAFASLASVPTSGALVSPTSRLSIAVSVGEGVSAPSEQAGSKKHPVRRLSAAAARRGISGM